MPRDHEVIVVGLGAWGAAAAHDLARSGHRVLGIDQYVHPHTHGSSHASTRVYREADTGGSIYVPFAVESLPAFRQLEQEFEVQLFQRTGAVYLSATAAGNHARTIADYRAHAGRCRGPRPRSRLPEAQLGAARPRGPAQRPDEPLGEQRARRPPRRWRRTRRAAAISGPPARHLAGAELLDTAGRAR